jgi:hypothetical protein
MLDSAQKEIKLRDIVYSPLGKAYTIEHDKDLDYCLLDPQTNSKEKLNKYNANSLTVLLSRI